MANPCHWWIHVHTVVLQYLLTCIGKITLLIFLQKHQGSLILLDAMSMEALRRRKQLPTPLLEFSSAALDPHLAKDIHQLERV